MVKRRRKEALEKAREEFERGAIADAGVTLQNCKQVFDLEHVDWLVSLLEPSDQNRRVATSEDLSVVQKESLRLVKAWASGLQANVPEDGVPVQDPLRDELIASAVTFLQDEAIQSRTAEDKIDFLVEKGLNKTEILIACAQVGVDPPASFQVNETIRNTMVQNGAAFLELETVKAKPLNERLAFLKTKGLNNAEIIRSCEIAKTETIPTLEMLKNLAAYKEREAREDMIQNGAVFLKHPSVQTKTIREKLEFLKAKGMIGDEIRQACNRAGVTLSPELQEEFTKHATAPQSQDQHQQQPQQSEVQADAQPDLKDDNMQLRQDMVDKGVTFLTHPKVKKTPMSEKLAFLRNKGLTEHEIKQACVQAGGDNHYAPPKATANSNVENAVKFLRHPSASSRTTSQKLQFLRGKGLSESEIKQAFQRVGVSPNSTSSFGLRMNLTSSNTDSEEKEQQDQDSMHTDTPESEEELDESLAKEKARKQRILQASNFLLNKQSQNSPGKSKVLFLLSKGMEIDEVQEAFRKVGLAWEAEWDHLVAEEDSNSKENEEEPIVRQALGFLANPKIAPLTPEQKLHILRKQGLSDKQVSRVMSLAGLDPALIAKQEASVVSHDEDPFSISVRFLKNPSTKKTSLASRISFLKSKGLSEEQIDQAFQKVGISNVAQAAEEEASILASLTPPLRRELVEQARAFLLSSEASQHSDDYKKEYLQRKGLTVEEIDLGFKLYQLARSNDAPASKEVLQGQDFILRTSTQGYSIQDQVSFLKSKGLTEPQVLQAFDLAGSSVSPAQLHQAYTTDKPVASQYGEGASEGRQALIAQAAKFLTNETARQSSPQDRVKYLRGKGLTNDEISQAIELANLGDGKDPTLVSATLREEQVERGVAFLLNPSVQDVPLEDRVVYLQNQGLTEEEVLEAALRAKVNLVPSYMCTIPTKKLKEDRFKESEETQPSGKTLQRTMNIVADLIARLGGQEPDEFAARAMSLLAVCLTRSRAGLVAPSCVAFSCKVISAALSRSRLSNCDSFPLQDLEDFLHAVMELSARAYRINQYAKEGLQQTQQVNLNFISVQNIALSVMKLWELLPAVDFSHGVLLARATHGSFCSVAAFQPFDQCSGPLVKCLLQQLESLRDESQDTAVYLAAGLLRGAPEYAWGKDVPKSPQPSLEHAIHALARSCMIRFEKADQVVSLFATCGPAFDEFALASGRVISVGLACVYADTQITWTPAVLQSVVEGLLGRALWHQDVFSPSDSISLDERAARANEFTTTEVFKLAPQLVTLILGKLPKPVNGSEHSEAELILFRWLIGRLYRFSNRVYSHSRQSVAVTGVIARRTVQLVYGTGDENQDTQQKEQSQHDEVSVESQQQEDTGDHDGQQEIHQDEEGEQDEDEDEEEEEEDEDEDGDVGDNVDGEDRTKSSVGEATTTDPLKEYLGVHSGAARLLQMGYLAVVILGSQCSASLDTEFALLLLDALANLNAFQIRVKEAVDLENLLQGLVLFQVKGGSSHAALAIYSLLFPHFVEQETAVAIPRRSKEDPMERRMFDWVLGARVEFLLGFGETWLLEMLQDSSGVKVPTSSNALLLTTLDASQNRRREMLVQAESVLDAFDLLHRSKKKRHQKKKKRNTTASTPRVSVKAKDNDDRDGGESHEIEQALSKETEDNDEISHKLFYSGMVEILLEVGVRHPFAHLNFRSHRWLVDIVRSVPEATSPSLAKPVELPLCEPPSGRLAIIPRYVETAIESYPVATTTKILSYVVASIFTALGEDPDEMAQPIAVMAFQRLMLAVDEFMHERAGEWRKKDGSTLATLMFTSLKAIALPALPSALDGTVDLIQRAPSSMEKDVKSGSEESMDEKNAPLFSREWFLDNLFGVISRTEDAPRRFKLAMWFLKDVEGLSTGGKL